MKILLLEDDAVLADILIDFLEESYSVVHAYSITDAQKLCDEVLFDLYIFDINLADGNGLDFLKSLRELVDFTPTIFITAFHDIKYLKRAFEVGANDFIRKPFELEELAQRIENIKKQSGIASLIIIDKSIQFDEVKHLLHKEQGALKKTVNLSKKQSDLLRYMYKYRNRVVSVDELLQNLWSYEEMPTADAIRTLIKELRKEIGKEHIINIRGEGYQFE